MGKKFAQGIGFLGTGSINFKLDPEDGIWKLIEMNGRIWLHNYHSAKSGLNMTLLQYLDSQNLPLPMVEGFKEGVVWWDSLSDFNTYLRLRKRHRLGFSEWVDSWFLPEVHAYFEKGDIGPALMRHRYGVEWAMMIGNFLRTKVDQDAIWDDLVKSS